MEIFDKEDVMVLLGIERLMYHVLLKNWNIVVCFVYYFPVCKFYLKITIPKMINKLQYLLYFIKIYMNAKRIEMLFWVFNTTYCI